MPWPSTPCRSAQPTVGPRVCGASLQRVVIAAASERVTAAGDLAAPSWPGALRRTDGSRPGQFAHAALRFPRLYTAQSPGIRALLSDPAEVTRPSSRLSVFAEPGNDVHRVPEILCPRNSSGTVADDLCTAAKVSCTARVAANAGPRRTHQPRGRTLPYEVVGY